MVDESSQRHDEQVGGLAARDVDAPGGIRRARVATDVKRRPKAAWRTRVFTALPERLRRDIKYFQSHKRIPSLRNPKTFNEKINWRILKDRRPELSWTGDKLAMKQFAKGCALVSVPTTCWAGTDINELTSLTLPDSWILKPNNASGRVIQGKGQVTPEDVKRLRGSTIGWLDPATYDHLCEWVYLAAQRVLLVEEFIGVDVAPIDYKFYVFDGEPLFIQVDTERFVDHKMSFYSTLWDVLPVHSRFPTAEKLPEPAHLDQMMDAARYLGRDFDFMRVDLYDVLGEVWFGELTPYPASGLMKIQPASFDRSWGALWRLPDFS
ncbi:MAG: uncharacterized protein JWO62_3117 [Acidimicrobiaceae bacterium]|nr:uncharacterized protein [Acidimicrobiaceae bacterium]